jgi:hypothetical protein
MPPQQLEPGGQSPCEPQVQAPATHICPEAHWCPQEPQLLGSLVVLMQVPPQQPWPDEHVVTQVPVLD